MFTIKQITKNGENIWEGNNPSFLAKGEGGKPTVSFQSPDGGFWSIDAGDVYVMNSAGNTVSRYHMDGQ